MTSGSSKIQFCRTYSKARFITLKLINHKVFWNIKKSLNINIDAMDKESVFAVDV